MSSVSLAISCSKANWLAASSRKWNVHSCGFVTTPSSDT